MERRTAPCIASWSGVSRVQPRARRAGLSSRPASLSSSRSTARSCRVRHGQCAAYAGFDLAVSPQIVFADGRGPVQVADGCRCVEAGDIGHDVEGPRRAVSLTHDEPVIVHDAEDLDPFHGLDALQHDAIRLPDRADLLARKVEESLGYAAAKQYAQRQRYVVRHGGFLPGSALEQETDRAERV